MSVHGRSELDPERLRAVILNVNQTLSPSITAIQESLASLSRMMAPMLEAQQQLARTISPFIQAGEAWFEANRETLIAISRGAEQFRRSWEEALPPNLRNLGADDFFAALEFVTADGPCVVWAPSTETIIALLACETFNARAIVLDERRDEVLADLDAALAESTSQVINEQANARDLAKQAVAAARDGHDAAAQALAAAGLGTVLHGVLSYGQLATAHKKMSEHDIEETSFQALRLVAIESATARALVKTQDHTAGFNRHGTSHGQITFYGPGEMLSALLLLVAWIRELSWIAQHEPESLAETP
jgi:hypothetical protein